MDLSSLTLGQLEALQAVLTAAISVGNRAEAEGQRFEATIDLDAEFATVAFSWPCRCPGSVEVLGWDLAATRVRAAVPALPAPAGEAG